ncbi:flippase [Shewanella abyssi]|uniref:flippase n=1 Tax=Shewanella abyssi TaxID=311789 RepID=UPI0020109A5F|nr:flippase [Shewanella abyssi]MCL1049587.1 flippase [Shewanella abyssi]
MSTLVKNVTRNASWLMSEKVVVMGANLLVNVLLARSMGPEGFGKLSYIIAIVAMFAPLAALGMNAIVTRELINSPDQHDKIIATTLAMRVFGSSSVSLICLTIAICGIGLTNEESRWGLIVLCLASAFSCFSVLEFWFQSKMAAKVVTRMKLAIVLFFSLIKIIAIYSDAEFIVLVSVFAIENVFVGLGFVYIYYKDGFKLVLKSVDFQYGLNLVKRSFWLILSGFAAIIYLKIDQIMLEQLSSTSEVGLYAVAARMSEVWYFFADAIVISLFPSLLLLKQQNNNKKYLVRLQKLSDILLLLGFVLAIFVTIIAKPFIGVVFGSDYLSSALILQIHIWACVFVFMRSMVSKWLIVEDLLRYSLISHGLGAVINVIVNYLLIPTYGGVGAAAATLISYFVASYLAFWFGRKTRIMAIIMSRSLLLPFTFGYRYWSIFK